MLRNKSVVSCVLIATLLASLSPLIMTYAQQQNQEQQNVSEQKFMEIAMRARERAYEMRDLVMEEIGDLPDGVEDLLEEADALLAEGTVQKAIEAMKRCRNAYRLVHRYMEQHGIDAETQENTRGIQAAVAYAYMRIERINNTLNAVNGILDETDPDYELVKKQLGWGWGNLTEAADSLELASQAFQLETPNTVWAAGNLTEANTSVREAHAALRLIAGWTNRWRVSNFLGELEQIRERIRARIQEGIQQGGFDLEAILEELGYSSLEDFEQAIDELMQNAQQRTEIREAVRSMWTIIERLREMDLGIQKRWQGSH